MSDLWRDMDFALPAGHPSTFEAECKQLRAENEALRNGDWSQIRLVRFENGQFNFNAGPVRYIAEYFAQMFEAGDGEYFNNMEIEFDHPEAGPMVLSAQRRFGKTPIQQRKEAEARVAELEAAMWAAIDLVNADLQFEARNGLRAALKGTKT